MNKPVAWMFEYGTDRGDAVNGISWYSNVHFKKPDLGGLIRNIEPLYTHPVKNNEGNPEELNTEVQDARISLESTSPYAYAVVQGEDGMENVSLQFDHPEMCGQKYRQAIPLFTHPVKKELTDEEIIGIADTYDWHKDCAIDFARAILRKAQEK